MKRYSRVTYVARCQIFSLLQSNTPIITIARILGLHRSTIYREIKRNSSKTGLRNPLVYRPEPAHILAFRRYKNCRRPSKIQGRIQEVVLEKLKKRWTPQQIAGRITLEGPTSLSHESIYRYIRRNPSLESFLVRNSRVRRQKRARTWDRPLRFASIHQRPVECRDRVRLGDWERDTMFAKDREALLVCADRKSRYCLLSRLSSIHHQEVAKATVQLMNRSINPVQTITNDNGLEFRSPQKLGPEIYFCDPQKPQQRGTIENTIGVIRRFIKQDTDLKTMDLNALEEWLNLRPRKILGYKTPFEIYYGRDVALAA